MIQRSSSTRRLVGALLSAGLAVAACGGESPPDDSNEPARPTAHASERTPGGDTTNELLLGSGAFKKPATNATREHEASFFTGNSFFNSAWVEAPSSTTSRDGLGPLFNARSCSACHFNDGRGRPPEEDEDFVGLLLRIGTGELGERGEPVGDPIYGDQLQQLAIRDVPAEVSLRVSYEKIVGEYDDGDEYELLSPTYEIDSLAYGDLSSDLRVSPRVAPIMVGLGLLEAISEAELLDAADPDDADDDGISGRVSWVWDVGAGEHRLGRFGWKSEQPSVAQQTAGAFHGDLGITSSLFPTNDCTGAEPSCLEAPNGGEPEIDDVLLGKVVLYSRLLAVPVRTRWDDDDILKGREIFHTLGCADCHTPSHETGESDLEELSHQKIWPYTDLLLHDLGDDLGDSRPAFDATGNEWRTSPLWGLGRVPEVNGHDRLLHDGRARGVAEAILWHGGEAEKSRDQFRALSRADRRLLIEFVESL